MKKVLLACLFLTMSFASFSSAFTAGNIVVVRVGTGAAALTNASQAVFLDEYTPAGVLVQSIALPTAASGSNHILTLTGTSTSEGELSLSSNGQYLVLAGFDVAPGKASVASDSTSGKTIARIGTDGLINSTTAITAKAGYWKSNIRGGVTNDGTGFWTSGNTTSPSPGGVLYIPFGSGTATPVAISTTVTNTRFVDIANGQLYVTTGSGNFKGVNAVGTGLPTTSGQTITAVPGLSSADTSVAGSPYGFHFFDLDNNTPGVDVVYVCDDRTRGGLMKYSLVGGTWVSNGKDSSVVGVRAVTGTATGSSVKLLVASETGLYTLTDASGYNQKLTTKLTSVATAGTNKRFRGIAFAPAFNCASPITANVTSVTNVTCNGGANGAINVTTTGGSNNYTYNWGGGVTTQNRTAIAAGTYTVTVDDGAGCTDTASATLTQPTAITITGVVTNLPCAGGNSGAIDITVSGGTPGYTYAWTGNVTTEDLSGLSEAKSYVVTVTDNATCQATKSFIISQSGNIVVTPSITNAKCFGDANGAINITVTGGTPAFNYSWTGGKTTEDISELAAGSYTLTLTDNGGCTLTNTYEVTQPAAALAVTGSVTNASSHGGSNGAVDITVTGGTATYTYDWNDGSHQQDLSGVSADEYCVIVTDLNLCSVSSCFTVSEPTGISETTWVNTFNVFVTGSNLNVTISLKEATDYQMGLYDITGNLISTFESKGATQEQKSISVSGMASGYYFLKMESQKGYAVRKVLFAR